ncbi:cupin domain-containing protein [Chitinibacter fontanus]|uniref:cupin domain-containing protein n=1 Tax=Chitinibacter fontanus TaxID=1737446 RepID=UPI0027E3C845|nr:hypothetical protein [Chitinibacter fontanus]
MPKTPFDVALLGNLTPEQFLAEYWQKKPLLIRQAWTQFPELIDFARLAQFAQRDDVESRLIEFSHGRWKLENGPFSQHRLNRLPATDWTILVQNVNHLVPHIADFLYQFNFLPYTRLDDVMISYAPPAGQWGRIMTRMTYFCCKLVAKSAGRFRVMMPRALLKTPLFAS